jgi:hypothetical protein
MKFNDAWFTLNGNVKGLSNRRWFAKIPTQFVRFLLHHVVRAEKAMWAAYFEEKEFRPLRYLILTSLFRGLKEEEKIAGQSISCARNEGEYSKGK